MIAIPTGSLLNVKDKPYQVLLVEDDLSHSELISRAFEVHTNMKLFTVHSLRDARNYLRKFSPDILITDYRLPDGNGDDLIIQKDDPVRCPVIIMTSFGDERIAVNAMKAGAFDYIVKTDTTLRELPVVTSRALRESQLILDKKNVLQEQRRLIAIMEATPDLICIVDVDGFLTYLNQAGRKMLGIAPEEELNKFRLSDFQTAEDASLITSEGIPYAIEHGVWTHETTFISNDSEQILTSQSLISHKSDTGEVEFFSTVARDIRDIRSAEEKIEYLAYYDTLTDLPNRNELLKHLDIEISKVKRIDTQSALLFIDLDNFKTINDSLGHPFGDRVLKAMAVRLKSTIRGGDILARLGGDEFVVLLTTLSNDPVKAINRARDVSRKLNQVIAQDIQIEEMTLNLTASIGISMFSSEVENAFELLRFADTAMYQAKKSGKNTFEVFHHDMEIAVARTLRLEQKLNMACKNNEFELFYQSKNHGETGEIFGAEALLRWNDPARGIVAPGDFLEVLESSGLIFEVGEWILEESFRQLAAWISEGLWNTKHRLSINISARQFQDEKFEELVIALIDKVDIPAECIDLEVTEHSVINDVVKAVAKMKKLVVKGITFSLDDFGTGYSSLSYLKSLPVATVKIDRSFINDITEDKSDEALVISIIAISKNLGLSTVAEGVETKQQIEMLRQHECDLLQGYYFSKPVPADDFEKLLRSSIQNETD